MVTISELNAGYYVVHEMPYGKTYAWYPGSITLECDCGQRAVFTGSKTICGWCEADHAPIIREELDARGRFEDEELHPWRYANDLEGGGLPF
jgi:hypothetical protein